MIDNVVRHSLLWQVSSVQCTPCVCATWCGCVLGRGWGGTTGHGSICTSIIHSHIGYSNISCAFAAFFSVITGSHFLALLFTLNSVRVPVANKCLCVCGFVCLRAPLACLLQDSALQAVSTHGDFFDYLLADFDE